MKKESRSSIRGGRNETIRFARHKNHYRREFYTIYWPTFGILLLGMPVRRLLAWAMPLPGPRVSMLAQARNEASIVITYALMGC